MSTPQILPPEKPESLGAKIKNLLLPESPQLPQLTEGSQSPSLQAADSPSGSSSDFDATATEIGEKYSGIPAPESGDSPAPEPGGASGPVPPGEVVSEKVVRAFLIMLTSALAQHHGNHWRMTEDDETILVPVNHAMANEQIPKLFGNLDNPALWAWCLVMAGWIGTKSENVGKAVVAGVSKIISIVGGGGGKVEG